MTENPKPSKADLVDWLSHAKTQLANRDFTGALQTLSDILQYAPDHREANNLLNEFENWEKFSFTSSSPAVQPQRNPAKSVRIDELSTTVEKLNDADSLTRTLQRPLKEPRAKAPSPFLIQSIEDNMAKGSASEALALIDLSLAEFPDHPKLAHLKQRAVELLNREAQPDASDSQGQTSVPQKDSQKAGDTLDQDDLKSALSPDLKETIYESPTQPVHKESPGFSWAVYQKPVLISIGVVGLLVAVFVGLRLTKTQSQFTELSVLSEPAGAKVYLDGEVKGTTPFQVRLELTGKERLVAFRLQLDNYEDHEGQQTLSAGQNRSIGPIKLLPKGLSPEETLYQKAVQAKNEGRLFPPEADNALDLLRQVLAISSETGIRSKTETLKQEIKVDLLGQLNALNASDAKTEKALELLEKLALVDPEDNEIRKQMDSFPNTIDRLKKQIEEAIANQRLLSSESGSALDLLKRLNRSSPTRERSYYLARKKEVRVKVLEVARQKCQTGGEACTSFIELALKDFPQDVELKGLREAADRLTTVVVEKAADNRLDRVKELMRKAESAFSAGRYVLPESDSAYFHATEALKQENPSPEVASYLERARDLASESLRLALKQAVEMAGGVRMAEVLASRESAEKRKADLQRAKVLVERIRAVGQLDIRNALQPADLAAQIKDLDDLLLISHYSVVHSHAFGGCKGKLTVSGHALQYQTDDSKDAFSKTYSELKDMKAEKKGELGMVFADRKREFKPEGKAEGQKLADEIVARIKHVRELRQRLSQR